MNLTSSETHVNFSNITNCFNPADLNMARINLANYFIVYLIPCFYCLFSFLSEYEIFYWNFSKLMEFLRSILAGLIISMFLDDQYKKIFHLDANKNVGVVLISNLPLFLLSSIYLLMFLGIGIHRAIRKRSNDYESILTDERTITPEIIEKNPLSSAKKSIKEIIKSEIVAFNARFAPIIYLSLIFIHAFFTGLGFFENKNIGWYEMIICTHKIFEIFRIKQAFDTLNLSKGKSFFLMLFFGIITPLGFMTKSILKINDVKVSDIGITQLSENIFAQSFLFVSYLENFVPFPTTKFDVAITWPISLLSFIYFNCYLKIFSRS